MNTAVTLTGLSQAVTYVIVGIFFIWLVKKVDDWRTKEFDDDAHIDDGNVAVGLTLMGVFIGVGTGMGLVIGLGLN